MRRACTRQALSGFEAQQARGAWMNELCEHYYRAHPRAHDAPWPSEKVRVNPNPSPSPSPKPKPHPATLNLTLTPSPTPTLSPTLALSSNPNQARKRDTKLRDMLSIPYPTGNKIREAASSRLGVQLQGPPVHWGWGAGDAFGIEPKRQPMAVLLLIDQPTAAPHRPTYSLLTTHYSLLATHYSLLTTHYY